MVLRGAQVIRRSEPEERGQLIPELSMCEGREDKQKPFQGSIREKQNKMCVFHPPNRGSNVRQYLQGSPVPLAQWVSIFLRL